VHLGVGRVLADNGDAGLMVRRRVLACLCGDNRVGVLHMVQKNFPLHIGLADVVRGYFLRSSWTGDEGTGNALSHGFLLVWKMAKPWLFPLRCCLRARWTVVACGADRPSRAMLAFALCRARPCRRPDIPFSTSIPVAWGSHDGRPPASTCLAPVTSLCLSPSTCRVSVSAV